MKRLCFGIYQRRIRSSSVFGFRFFFLALKPEQNGQDGFKLPPSPPLPPRAPCLHSSSSLTSDLIAYPLSYVAPAPPSRASAPRALC